MKSPFIFPKENNECSTPPTLNHQGPARGNFVAENGKNRPGGGYIGVYNLTRLHIYIINIPLIFFFTELLSYRNIQIINYLQAWLKNYFYVMVQAHCTKFSSSAPRFDPWTLQITIGIYLLIIINALGIHVGFLDRIATMLWT